VTIAIAPHLDETGEIKLLIWLTAKAEICPSRQFVAERPAQPFPTAGLSVTMA
jgi:hypothetical protein